MFYNIFLNGIIIPTFVCLSYMITAMILNFFWIPIIELIYAIGFLLVFIFNLIVDYWWVILLIVILCIAFAQITDGKK